MSGKHYSAVFLSPHLDDAVFSCAGEIALLAREGPVSVMNIFTQYGTDDAGAAVVLGPERYAEESAAAALLGYDSYRLDEPDAFFRHPRFRSIGNIFKPLMLADLDYYEQLRERVYARLAELDFERLYVPLAIGWHVDHMLTFMLAVHSPYREKLYFYEDVPYCQIDGASQARWAQLGIATESPSANWRRVIRAFWHNGMMKNFGPLPLRLAAYPAVCIYFWRLIRAQHAVKQPLPALRPEIRDVSLVIALKLQAIAAYASQVKELFVDADDVAKQYQRYSASLGAKDGQSFERFWRF